MLFSCFRYPVRVWVQQLRIEQSLVELAITILEKYPPTQEPSTFRHIWEFPKIRGTLLGGSIQ